MATTVERIERAIKKLEKLRAESTPKPWHDWTDDLTGEVDVWHDQEQRSHVANCGVAGMPRVEADAELIVTLHRTIDPQLEILREGLALMESNEDIEVLYANELALADSILGEA